MLLSLVQVKDPEHFLWLLKCSKQVDVAVDMYIFLSNYRQKKSMARSKWAIYYDYTYEFPPEGPDISHLLQPFQDLCCKLCDLNPSKRLNSQQALKVVAQIAYAMVKSSYYLLLLET